MMREREIYWRGGRGVCFSCRGGKILGSKVDFVVESGMHVPTSRTKYLRTSIKGNSALPSLFLTHQIILRKDLVL